jgi:hypothetical protein
MSTRPCRYCLAIKDDSVFIDLDVDDKGCLFLVRISFDGYGCCEPNKNKPIGKISESKSKKLIKQIKANKFEILESQKILTEYLSKNKEYLWEDALQEHELI